MCVVIGLIVYALIVAGIIAIVFSILEKNRTSIYDRDMAKCTRREFIRNSGINLSKK